MTRYAVVRDDYPMPCEHPLCWQLHQRYMTRCDEHLDPALGQFVDRYHEVMRRQWVIVDTATGERAFDGEGYEARWLAADALRRNLRTMAGAL